MKLLLDFFPILLFFGAFKIWGIFVATTVAIVATLIQLAWMRYSTGRTEPMQWLSLGVIVVFGGATLIAQDETFIKWKPSVLYWAMGGALLVGQVFFRRNWLQSLMKSQMALPDHAWRVMLWSWCGFFAVMGVLNLWVAYHFDTDTWVNFKLFGGMGLMLVFVLAQAMYLGRFMDNGEVTAEKPESKP
ncbi:COG2917 Intracellular septation protein A [Burkholderiaceae bacterium]|jgi:intracellular septation protein